jgi:predicted molibdopterin-dependent oxidoreductase YjgC
LPILDLRLKKAAFQKKASLVVVNNASTSLDELAKSVLRADEGSEAGVINALSKLVHQSWHDEPTKTEMLQQLAAQSGARDWLDSLAPYSSGAVAQSAGVDESTLRAAAEAISNSERLFLLVGANAAPEVLAALQNLAALKNRSDAVVVLQPEANAVGVRRAGLVPGEGGKSGAEILQAAANGEIEVLFLAATNPLNGAQDFETARAALEKTPFVVAQTLFQNEVTEYADVVLPAASFMEQDGTTTNFHGRVQKLNQVFRPRERRDEDGTTLSACAPDWMIFTKIALLLGAEWPYKSVEDWTAQNSALPAALPAQTQFVAASGNVAQSTPVQDGALRLVTGPLLYDGGESFKYSSRLSLVVPEPFIKIHRADARKLGIENKALVEIKTSRGSAKVRANIGREVKQGTAWLPARLNDVRANALLDTGGASTLVTITKLEDAPQPDPAEPVVVTA